MFVAIAWTVSIIEINVIFRLFVIGKPPSAVTPVRTMKYLITINMTMKQTSAVTSAPELQFPD